MEHINIENEKFYYITHYLCVQRASRFMKRVLYRITIMNINKEVNSNDKRK